MKRFKVSRILSLFTVLLLSGAAFSGVECDDWTAVDFSIWPPVQIPIPWAGYCEQTATWGDFSVYGLSFGLPYAEHEGVYGVNAGVFNRVRTLRGLQIGLVNLAQNVAGVQIGLWNANGSGPVRAFPILNVGF